MAIKKTPYPVALAAAISLLAAGCGGEADEASGQSGAGELQSVTVAETVGIPSAFLTYGVQEGYFEENGLEVTVDTSAGGAAAIPGLINGSLQVAGSNVVSVLLASQQGLDLRMVSSGTGVGDDPEADFGRVMVLADSPIRGPEDLASANVSANTLANISEVSIRASLENQGIDSSNVTFTELGFPDMLPALEAKDIDAAFLIEPFATMAAGLGARSVLSPYVGMGENSQIGAYVMTAELVEQDPALAADFRAGVKETVDSIAADPQAFRDALPEIADMDPNLVNEIELPVWSGAVDQESLQGVGNWMVEFELIPEEPDYDSIVLP